MRTSPFLPTAVRIRNFLFLSGFHHQARADSLIICVRYVRATQGQLGRITKSERRGEIEYQGDRESGRSQRILLGGNLRSHTFTVTETCRWSQLLPSLCLTLLLLGTISAWLLRLRQVPLQHFIKNVSWEDFCFQTRWANRTIFTFLLHLFIYFSMGHLFCTFNILLSFSNDVTKKLWEKFTNCY